MNLSEKRRWHFPRSTFSYAALALLGVITVIGGCEKKEKVMEIKTPGFNLEVNKTTSPTGEKGMEIKSQGNDKTEIDATHKKSTSEN